MFNVSRWLVISLIDVNVTLVKYFLVLLQPHFRIKWKTHVLLISCKNFCFFNCQVMLSFLKFITTKCIILSMFKIYYAFFFIRCFFISGKSSAQQEFTVLSRTKAFFYFSFLYRFFSKFNEMKRKLKIKHQ